MVYYRNLPTTSFKATEVESDMDEPSGDFGGDVGILIDF